MVIILVRKRSHFEHEQIGSFFRKWHYIYYVNQYYSITIWTSHYIAKICILHVILDVC